MKKSADTILTRSTILKDRGGNFGLMAAVVLPVLLASGGVALDMANMMMTQNRLQDATDAAALAASSALAAQGMTHEQARLLALDFIRVQTSDSQKIADPDETKNGGEEDISSLTEVTITEAATLGTGKSYKVEVSLQYPLALNPMTQLLGREEATIGTRSVAESSTQSKNALSMFMVFDRSGSMAGPTGTVDASNPTVAYTYQCGGSYWRPRYCTGTMTNYVTKIAALKVATADLLTQLQTSDPTATLVRTGAVSYNSDMQAQSDLGWGVTSVLTYVNALAATGGTNSSDAFKTAYQKLTASAENTAHKTKNGQVPTKYIVFMTDGENNYAADDTTTKQWCDKARTDKIEVYSIAFMAPDRGQALLKYCATSAKHYFPAESASELTAAFKYIGEKASELSSRLTR